MYYNVNSERQTEDNVCLEVVFPRMISTYPIKLRVGGDRFILGKLVDELVSRFFGTKQTFSESHRLREFDWCRGGRIKVLTRRNYL